MTSNAGTATAESTAGVAPRGSHDWHSGEYVRQWVADNEARAGGRRPQFDLLADFISHPSGAAISLLDVGAGWGPVTRHLLGRFPAARATLLDYSEEMFGEARSRMGALGDRVRYVQGDLSQPGAVAAAVDAAGAPFDAIVSSSCIHNIRPTERIPVLYAELRTATAPGGCFLNLDMVGTPASFLQDVWRRARIEQYRRRQHAATGHLPPYEEAEAALAAERPRRSGIGGGAEGHSHGAAAAAPPPAQPTFGTSGARTRSLLDHLTWLRDAGFDGVDCFWRQENRALIGGYVAPTES
jgi:hypothetical protein